MQTPAVSLLALILLAGLVSGAAPGNPLLRTTVEHGIATTATDAAGNIYVCGQTLAPHKLPGRTTRIGPLAPGEAHAFVLKLRADGKVLGGVALGGNSYDTADRIAIDAQGNVVVAGTTLSSNFPTVNAIHSTPHDNYDVFVCRLDANLTQLQFSTYLGGNSYDYTRALVLDADGNILVGGLTASSDFPTPKVTSDNFYEGFVIKLSADGTQLVFSTRLRGRGTDVRSIAVDSAGNACAVGSTMGEDFPLLNAVQQFKPAAGSAANAFLVRLDPSGALLASTFLGGACNDEAVAVALNQAGEIHVAGTTSSQEVATEAALGGFCTGSNRSFFVKLDAGATNLIYSKTFSVYRYAQVTALAFDPLGTAMVGGWFGPPGGDSYQPFVATVTPDGFVATHLMPSPCGVSQLLFGLTLEPSGTLLATGYEVRHESASEGSYVARIDAATWMRAASPGVRIISPMLTAVLSAREPLTVQAITWGFPGPVDVVSFYNGRRLLGTSTVAPYQLEITNLARGGYSLRAVAQGGGLSVTSCAVSVRVRVPRNDDFAQRIRLRTAHVVRSGSVDGATREPEEQYGSGETVWYSWRAPRDGVFEFRFLQGTSSDVFAGVFVGEELASLVDLGSFEEGTPLTLSARRGDVFQIQISDDAPYRSRFRFRIRPVRSPSNDPFENAVELAGVPVTAGGRLTHASADPGDPVPYARTVWYAWTAPASGLYLAALESGGMGLKVFAGSELGNLVSVGQEIHGVIRGEAFYTTAGERYSISVFDYGVALAGAGPDFTFSITEREPPANDHFANRFPLLPGTMMDGTCIGATSEPGEPSNFGFTPPRTIWWSWVAPSGGVYRVAVEVAVGEASGGGLGVPADPSGPAAIYSGNNLSQLTRLSPLWRAEAGVEYQIAVANNAASFTIEVLPVPQPPNDLFANAELLNRFSGTSGTLDGAGLEPHEPSHSGFLPKSGSVWYQWVAPSNGLFVIESSARVDIYAGLTLPTLTRVNRVGAGNIFRAEAGVRYSLAVFEYTGFVFPLSSPFTLRMRPAFPPSNDDFAHAQALPESTTHFTARTHDATSEPGEPAGSSASTVWFSWTAPETGNYVLTCTNVYGAGILVYAGLALHDLVPIASSYNGPADFNATAGEEFFFAFSSSEPILQITLGFRLPPSNDHFTDATVLAGTNVSVLATNAGATAEPDEPQHAAFAAGKSVWFVWTAPQDGRATFSATGDFMPALALYTGNELASLARILPGNSVVDAFNVPVVAGTAYRIALDGNAGAGASGIATLNIYYVTPPDNDAFADRLPFTTGQVTGTIEGASLELLEPDYQNDPSVGSVWWTFTPPSNGMYRVVFTAPFGELLLLSVFQGTNLSSLERVSSSIGIPDAGFLGTAGVPYAIRVGTFDGRFPTFTLTIQFEPHPINDAFTNRISFTNSVLGTLKGATRETNEPQTVNQNSASVWFDWTAPQSGFVYLTFTIPGTPGGDLPYGLSAHMFTGDTLEGLIEVPAIIIQTEVRRFFVTAGTNYSIQIGSTTFEARHIALSMLYHPGPANDYFADRIALTGSVVSVSGTTRYATEEPPEPFGRFTVWYSWTPDANGLTHFKVTSSPYHFIGIYTGASSAVLIYRADTANLGGTNSIAVTAGTEYQLRVQPGGFFPGVATGNFSFTISNVVAAPLALSRTDLRATHAPSLTIPANAQGIIETSTNLRDWQPWLTNRAGGRVSLPVTDEPQRFFRVR